MPGSLRPGERIRGEAGFTLVESVVAALLVAMVSLAVMAAIDTSRRATFRAEQSQVASDMAERELEQIRALGYTEIGLAATPTGSADPDDPRSRISGLDFGLEKDGSDAWPLVIEGGSLIEGGAVEGAAVDPGPAPFTSGDVSGEIHRFVVWQDDPSCPETLVCPGAQDLKRIVVAVTLDVSATGGSRNYVEVQSDVIDADDSILTDADPPDLGDLVVAQQFWLSDERCVPGGEPAHTVPLTSHAARDTFGINCEAATADRPDALVTTPPVNVDQTIDFSTDVTPNPAATDAGLQFELGTGSSCPFMPTGSDGHLKSHIWVSKKFDSTFELSGGGTLELWGRTIDGIAAGGTLCVRVFTRQEDPLGALPPTDSHFEDLDNAPNTYFTFTVSEWPQDDWGRIRIPMNFASGSVLPGERLGVSIGLQASGSPTNELMVGYDEGILESRLEIETTTPLPPPA